MKLFVAALAATAVRAEDCPLGWTAGEVDGECSPDEVVVTCNADEMIVTFPIDAVYFSGSTELSDDQKALAAANVVDSEDDDCLDFEYDADAGTFTVTHGLTECDTKADHDADAGELVFSNSYTGDEAALTVDGILTTKVLSFKAECTYSDQATVSIDDVTISMGTNVAETVSQTGKYTFNMVSLDVDGEELDADNKAEIGDQVTLKITPAAALPSNVEFHIVDCVAAEAFAEDGTVAADVSSYDIIKEGSCVSDLLEVQFDGAGKANDQLLLDFNSFTFAAEEDELDIKCDLKLCLTDDADCLAAVQQKNADFTCADKYSRSSWFTGLDD